MEVEKYLANLTEFLEGPISIRTPHTEVEIRGACKCVESEYGRENPNGVLKIMQKILRVKYGS